MKLVAGVVNTWRDAERAIVVLHEAGFHSERVRLIVGDPRKAFDSARREEWRWWRERQEGAGIGSVIGGVMGWVADAVELGALEIEEIIASGPVAALVDVVDPMIIAGIGIGGIVGGLLGTHAGWSFAEGEAKTYSMAVTDGGVMLVVQSDGADEVQRAVNALRDAHAQHIHIGMADS